jgi:hypothetical protein
MNLETMGCTACINWQSQEIINRPLGEKILMFLESTSRSYLMTDYGSGWSMIDLQLMSLET